MTCENIEQFLIVAVFALGASFVILGTIAFLLDERVKQQEKYIKRLEAEHWDKVKRKF